MNGCFPVIKIVNDYNKKECNKMLSGIIEEIKKEKKDDFPYSLAYQEQLKINFCIKHTKIFNFLNLLIFFLIGVIFLIIFFNYLDFHLI
jgi:hypothetical protein